MSRVDEINAQIVMLAHALKDQTESAYQRAGYFENRAVLKQSWADYCYGEK